MKYAVKFPKTLSIQMKINLKRMKLCNKKIEMEIKGHIIEFNSKGNNSRNVNIKHKYDNIFIEVDEDSDTISSMIEKGYKVRNIQIDSTFRYYLSINIVSKSKVDRAQLNNEYGGTFEIDIAKNGVVWLRSAKLESIFE